MHPLADIESSGGAITAGNNNVNENVNIAGGTRALNIGNTNTTLNTFGTLTHKGDVTVGENLSGHTVRFHGSGDSKTLEWNPTNNKLVVTGTAGSNALEVTGNTSLTGNLNVTGTTTFVNSTTVTKKDPVIVLGGNDDGAAPVSNDQKDRGIQFNWHNGTNSKTGFFGFDEDQRVFTFIQNQLIPEVFTGTRRRCIIYKTLSI